jgi:hypothetical protein
MIDILMAGLAFLWVINRLRSEYENIRHFRLLGYAAGTCDGHLDRFSSISCVMWRSSYVDQFFHLCRCLSRIVISIAVILSFKDN